MAFHSPTHARQQLQLPRTNTYDSSSTQNISAFSSLNEPSPTSETEEWVVFSPSTVAGTHTGTLLSRNSEIGSTYTVSSAQNTTRDVIPGGFDEVQHIYEEDEEEDDDETMSTETDSLQAFAVNNTGDGTVRFPAHDGLGTFSSSYGGYRSLQESLRLVAAASETTDKTARINKWRIEQSQAFIEEIERATRRRRFSVASCTGEQAVSPENKLEEDVASMADTGSTNDASAETPKAASVAAPEEKEEEAHNESFWKRITRSFIRDIIGIDDSLLEVLFGEALPEEAYTAESAEVAYRRNVEEKLLDRITQELGELVKLYSSPPARYAPSTVSHQRSASTVTSSPAAEQSAAQPPTPAASTASVVPDFPFAPTLTASKSEEASHAALWGIDEPADRTQVDAQLKKEYWEQDLDMRLVFSYIKSHFTRHTATPTAPTSPPIRMETGRMRVQHPLIARSRGIPVKSARSGSGRSRASSRRGAYYWEVATSAGSGKSSCVGTGIWAAI